MFNASSTVCDAIDLLHQSVFSKFQVLENNGGHEEHDKNDVKVAYSLL